MTATVSVNGIVKNYHAVQALRDVSFDLGPGGSVPWLAITVPARPR